MSYQHDRVDLRQGVRQLHVCRRFTIEFTTIVHTISFVNTNQWSHTSHTIGHITDHDFRPFVNALSFVLDLRIQSSWSSSSPLN